MRAGSSCKEVQEEVLLGNRTGNARATELLNGTWYHVESKRKNLNLGRHVSTSPHFVIGNTRLLRSCPSCCTVQNMFLSAVLHKVFVIGMVLPLVDFPACKQTLSTGNQRHLLSSQPPRILDLYGYNQKNMSSMRKTRNLFPSNNCFTSSRYLSPLF